MLPVSQLISPNMSPDMCFDHCRALGMRYAGLQNANECYCGNGYELDNANHSRTDDFECNMTCADDPNSICGDNLRNSVYELEGMKFKFKRRLI